MRILEDAGVQELVDVRSVPRSRRHPQFNADSLAVALPAAGIGYSHERALGGFRRPVPGSRNGGWREQAFQGYADHMAGEEFRAALQHVERLGHERTACVMCAEAQWWRCHRRLIADVLVVRGWRVEHLGLGGAPRRHELTTFAVADGKGWLSYPPAQQRLPDP